MATHKKRRRREVNYGNVKRRPARKGVLGLDIAVLGLALLAFFIYKSAANGGNLKPVMGAFTIMVFALGGFGLWLSFRSFHEIDKSYTVSRIAVWANGILMFAILIIYILGIR